MPKNVGDLGKLIVAKGFKKLPKVQKITQSGHTGTHIRALIFIYFRLFKHTLQFLQQINV